MFNKNNLLKGDAIKKGITTFSASMAKVDETVHILACSALTHAAETGDTTYCTDLVNAMPRSSRGVSLRQWFVQYAGCIQWTTVAGEAKFKKIEGKQYNMEKVVQGYEHPFYEKEETVAKSFDLPALLKLLDGISKRAASGRVKGTLKVTPADLVEIRGKVAGIVREVTPLEVINQSVINSNAA